MQGPTIRTFNIHFSHVMNSPIWVKRLTCQGKRRLDREIGKERWNIDSRNQRLRDLWNGEIWKRRWKNRGQDNINNGNYLLRNLQRMY
jgi:hypothetical protein